MLLALLSTRKHPPGGFRYKCPKCGWKIKNPLNTWTEIAREIARHESNNPDHNATSAEIKERLHAQTCARVPSWCGDGQAVVVAEQSNSHGCKTCRRRKKTSE